MDAPELEKLRGSIITRAIEIEKILAVIISYHYLKRLSQGFLLEVLYDEGFSFGMKLRIACKISPVIAKHEQTLRRLASIRNVFAHMGLVLEPTGEPHKVLVPDTRRPGKEINFADLATEFDKLTERLGTFAVQAMVASGVAPAS
jgi:hypothetical protein